MNRAELVRALAACEALAEQMREALNADARAEFDEQGTAPTWRMRDFTVTASLTKDTVVVADPAAFMKWVKLAYPAAVEEQVNPQWQRDFLNRKVRREDPPSDVEGQVIPGLGLRPGGQIKAVSVLPAAEVKARLTQAAAEIVAGQRPLALPTEAVSDADR